jgi:hypothetical protein
MFLHRMSGLEVPGTQIRLFFAGMYIHALWKNLSPLYPAPFRRTINSTRG